MAVLFRHAVSGRVLCKTFDNLVHFLSNKSNCFREMSKSACVLLAPGHEEIEFTSSVDVLRRAQVSFGYGVGLFKAIFRVSTLYVLGAFAPLH